MTRSLFGDLDDKAMSARAAQLVDFVSTEGKPYYKVPSNLYREWATNVLSLLHRVFGEPSIHYKHLAEHYSKFNGWVSDFDDSYAIFRAAREDYEGGYLFHVRTLAKAEVLADAISQAKELLVSGYKDPACILARVALESTLKDLASRYGVQEGKLDRMNADLTRAGAYNMAKQKQITAWADIGNRAAHGDWAAYTSQDAHAMVLGVESLVADL